MEVFFSSAVHLNSQTILVQQHEMAAGDKHVLTGIFVLVFDSSLELDTVASELLYLLNNWYMMKRGSSRKQDIKLSELRV